MSNSTYTTRFLCLTAVMAAITCIATMVIQIPIPLGYAHLGDAFILLTVLFIGRKSGIWAGGIGSALADLLTGYAYWAIPTFIIKSLMAYFVGKIAYKDDACKLFSGRTLLACVVGMVWMVVGYTVAWHLRRDFLSRRCSIWLFATVSVRCLKRQTFAPSSPRTERVVHDRPQQTKEDCCYQ